ncbi:hypothetical protein [Marinifilum flexuosum]|nr:hypothetical protein [Marinifilum flexuosum]
MKMKFWITLGFLMYSTIIFSQNNSNHIFFKVIDNKIHFYLDNVGDITTKDKAQYHRISQLDDQFSYIGKIEDYFSTGNLAYECYKDSNCIFYKAKAYHNNGKLRYEGFLNQSYPDSLWTYFYDNGNLQKKIIFKNNQPLVLEFYKRNGKNVFTNGNGKYKDKIFAVRKQPIQYYIWGKIKDGKIHGKWSWKGNSTGGYDFFKDGKYVEKEEIYGLKDSRFISLLGFDIHENIDVFKFIAIPTKNYKSTKKASLVPQVPIEFSSSTFSFHSRDLKNQLKYKNSLDLDSLFIQDIKECLHRNISDKSKLNFGALIQFTVSKDNTITNIQVHCNSVTIQNCMTNFISTNRHFQACRNESETIDCHVYMCIIGDNGKLYIPQYNFDNQRINISNMLN